mmetsp:Transcript_28545/g.66149  ORF Transcript_28545/g.66149 Transcript_28545/m.66149 type:complete len:303 (+) Transcript_28545:46-954(+)|eukprot:CAMPEP_0178430666 /NCGR_PEP_ID=MMETSP0689_2-20121128/31440_1 /TAXON_ID=160604 /ORGANISM="Amphidinium massartii, Strain CS-259" /LENGTH=302 /DNA_ID=CAMNT_0020052535 /DNA_START=48 /DNA_END=956 /DNA_ORIENTATION=+
MSPAEKAGLKVESPQHPFKRLVTEGKESSTSTIAAPHVLVVLGLTLLILLQVWYPFSGAIAGGSLEEALNGPTAKWLMEDLVGTERLHMGLPGLAAVGVFINPLLETVNKIKIDRDTRRTPLLPFSAMATSCTLWFTYGILREAPGVVCPNIIGMTLGLYYCYVFQRFCPKGANWLPYTLLAHAIVFLVTLISCVVAVLAVPTHVAAPLLGVVGNVAGIIMTAGPLASVRTVVEEKSTRSLAFGFTCCLTVNATLWFTYGFWIIGDAMIWAPNLLNLFISSLQLSLFAVYGFGPGNFKEVDA